MCLYVFFDIDGVLNTMNDWRKPYVVNENNVKCFANAFSQYTDVKFILISSWRKGWNQEYALCTPQIQNLVKIFAQHELIISDVTKQSPIKDRGAEILYYIQRHNVKKYIIIDDDMSEYKTVLPGIQIVDANKGFVKLNKKKIINRRR